MELTWEAVTLPSQAPPEADWCHTACKRCEYTDTGIKSRSKQECLTPWVLPAGRQFLLRRIGKEAVMFADIEVNCYGVAVGKFSVGIPKIQPFSDSEHSIGGELFFLFKGVVQAALAPASAHSRVSTSAHFGLSRVSLLLHTSPHHPRLLYTRIQSQS